ncbi:hypothetical protein R3P38DRAFT_3211583 [Favolaschia claudopus]|uniref:Uncharacterized protein n=1 Tax=Favolaschia claudopus TaxID=2862362 RepID=A0AAW0AFV7_9AGAR
MDLSQLAIGPLASGNLPGAFGSQPFESLIKSLIDASEEKIALHARSLKLVLCPVRKLPDELLAMIMRLTLEKNSRRIDAATLVVCALRLTQLPIQYKKPDGYSADYIAATRVHLERSAPLPIEIDLDHCAEPPPALVDALFSTASRWKSLSFSSGPTAIFDALAKLPPDSLKLLEEAAGTLWDSVPATYAFLCAPRLRKVNLHLYNHASNPPPMPWAQLTALDLSMAAISAGFDILVQCTNVVRAKLYAEPPRVEPTGSSSDAPVTLPFLEDLNVSIYGDHLGACFGRLSLPKLRKLEISFTDPMGSGDWSPANSSIFTQFQLRSPNIEDFSLSICDIHPPELREILTHVPRLTDLHLECCFESIDDDVLEHLEYAELDTVHLTPQLQRLHLAMIGDSFDEDRLLAMIKSRWWSAAALQALPVPPPVARWERVYIYRGESDVELSGSFKRAVRKLKTQGLEIEVS